MIWCIPFSATHTTFHCYSNLCTYIHTRYPRIYTLFVTKTKITIIVSTLKGKYHVLVSFHFKWGRGAVKILYGWKLNNSSKVCRCDYLRLLVALFVEFVGNNENVKCFMWLNIDFPMHSFITAHVVSKQKYIGHLVCVDKLIFYQILLWMKLVMKYIHAVLSNIILFHAYHQGP